MTLEPIRLDTAYACPTHTTEIQATAGKCRIDGRALVPVTVSLYFSCSDNPTVHELNPGTCADGKPRFLARERRAHGDHNPRHGGQFFMASDNFHHLEGTYPREGVFRLYFYDDYTRPLGRSAIANFAARAVTREAFDPATKAYKDIESVPLVSSKDGRYLEAHVPGALPAQITAKVTFKANDSEHRFDFSFATITTEPKPGAPIVVAPPIAAKAQFEAPVADDAPRTTEALLGDLSAESKSVEAAVTSGAFGQIYLSALAAKDAALRLEASDADQPESTRVQITAAVRQIVLAAWLLDQYGDLGDRQRIDEAHQEFATAVAALLKAYAR
jgi:cation transport regulator ChaB